MRNKPQKIDGRKQRSLRNRKSIQKAAKAVFLEKGYSAATFKEISTKANVGYGTIYLHFKDKEALLCSIVDEVMATMGKEVYIEYNPSKTDDVKSIVYTQISNVLKLARQNREALRIIWDALGHSEAVRSYWNDIFTSFINRTIDDLSYSQEYGLARPLDRTIIAKCIVYMIREFIWDIVWEKEYDIDKISQNIVELYLYGAYKFTDQTIAGKNQ